MASKYIFPDIMKLIEVTIFYNAKDSRKHVGKYSENIFLYNNVVLIMS